jgi:hypothetical protein
MACSSSRRKALNRSHQPAHGAFVGEPHRHPDSTVSWLGRDQRPPMASAIALPPGAGRRRRVQAALARSRSGAHVVIALNVHAAEGLAQTATSPTVPTRIPGWEARCPRRITMLFPCLCLARYRYALPAGATRQLSRSYPIRTVCRLLISRTGTGALGCLPTASASSPAWTGSELPAGCNGLAYHYGHGAPVAHGRRCAAPIHLTCPPSWPSYT